MSSLNKVMLIGRLGADPEIRRMNNGDPIVNFRIATSEVWRDKNSGERKEKTEWHQIVVFNQNLCKLAEQYLKKGNIVYLEGMLCTRQWEDQGGQKRYSTEVVIKQFVGDLRLLPQGGGRQEASSPDDYGSGDDRPSGTSTRQERSGTPGGGRHELDDKIPF